jgi:hypothetical protein
MQWGLGPWVLGTLPLMPLAVGAFAQLLLWRGATWWVGIVSTAAVLHCGDPDPAG